MSLDAPASFAIDGAPFSVGIVAARYNAELVEALLEQVTQTLSDAGVKPKNIVTCRVPGANELPAAAQLLIGRWKLDVVIALGVVIRGGTIHYELVCYAASEGLQRVSLDTHVPVIVGVVAAENRGQAEERCRGAINRGAEFARAALEMAVLKKDLSS